MNLHTIWVISKAEIRSCRRLVRTWVFVSLAYAVGTIMYVQSIWNASNWSRPRPPIGWVHSNIDSRYDINVIADGFGVILIIGIIFLCFDIRARDVRNRISEVFDSKPIHNFEVLVGRVAGILAILVIPIFFFLTVVVCYEVIARLSGIPHNLGLLPISVVSRVVWDVFPSLLLFGTLVVFLTLLVRHRLIAVLITFTILLGLAFFADTVSFRLQESLGLFTNTFQIHSDLAPSHLSSSVLISRVALLLLSSALITFASVLLPRLQPRRSFPTIWGSACVVMAFVCFISLFNSFVSAEALKNKWVNVHDAQPEEAFPDVKNLEGRVEVWPGRVLAFDLTLTVAPPTNNSTETLIFSLNPNFRIQKVHIDGEESSNYSFRHGILAVSSTKFDKETHQLRIQAKGKPDKNFAFLDQARNYQELVSPYLPKLGSTSYLFHSNFVALMPDIKWYPTSGTAVNEDVLELRPRDSFTLDLSVSVPRNWKVALVGNRELLSSEKRTMYRFKTDKPVPDVTLITANFDSRSTTIEGIDFELLFSKKHVRNLIALTPYSEKIEAWIAEHIKRALALSLEYPYEKFYVVEVPSTLRIYGGGWRMRTVLNQPGMMLVRETTFPTAPFQRFVQEQKTGETSDESIVLDTLVHYFEDDLQGGSPFEGFASNFLNHQCSSVGPGGTTLDYLVAQMVNQLVTQRESLFVPSLWNYGMSSAMSLGPGHGPGYVRMSSATRSRRIIARLPSTWETLEDTALLDLDFGTQPIPAYRALLTKGHALAKSIIEYYGANDVASFLKVLTHTYSGTHYTLENFISIAAETNLDFNAWVLPWLEATELPAYIATTPTVSKLESPTLGGPKYQTTFILHNSEPVSGFARVYWTESPHGSFTWISQDEFSDPVFVPGQQSVRFAIKSFDRLTGIRVEPILSQNRATFAVPIPTVEEEYIPKGSIQPFTTIVAWEPPDDGAIIVDDLDPGFSIVGQVAESKETLSFPFTRTIPIIEDEIDLGLPVRTFPIISNWERQYDAGSYGYYRRTHVQIAKGKQTTHVKFAAKLPHTGRWKLEFFLPEQAIERAAHGFKVGRKTIWYRNTTVGPNVVNAGYSLEISDGPSTWNEKFDTVNAKVGWNEIDTFSLATTDIDVLLSDFAGQNNIIVYADAIRWTPVDIAPHKSD